MNYEWIVVVFNFDEYLVVWICFCDLFFIGFELIEKFLFINEINGFGIFVYVSNYKVVVMRELYDWFYGRYGIII